MPKLELNSVTLCAATSVNVEATTEALRSSLDQVSFADCILFTDRPVSGTHPGVRVVPIEPMRSSRDYSEFLLTSLVDHLMTEHCLVVQWDGFVADASQWDERFLDFDYIGAPWPQFDDGHDVGNGGFSLRSRKLLEACCAPGFTIGHPEDVAICRTNRAFLEGEHGIRFADRAIARRYAFERSDTKQSAFGFHGIFNMIPVLGADRFWRIYETLDDKRSAFVDYRLLMRQLGTSGDAAGRRLRLTKDRFFNRFRAS